MRDLIDLLEAVEQGCPPATQAAWVEGGPIQ